jgi:hypothetical protein
MDNHVLDGRRSRVLVLLLLLGAAMPAAVTLLNVQAYGVDVPYADQWWLAPMFERLEISGLAPNGLFGQANESRPALPRLFFLALASWDGWDVRREMYATQGLLILTSLGLALLARRLGASLTEAALALVLANMALFSGAQTFNYLWGIQFIVYVPFACLVWSAAIAVGPRSDTVVFTAATLLALAATYSYANGMILWPLTAILLLSTRGIGRGRRWLWVLWATVGVATVTTYFAGYVHPRGHPDFAAALRAPMDAVTAFLAFFGNALTVEGRYRVRALPMAVAAGSTLLALAGFILALGWPLRRDRQCLRSSVVWATLLAYTVGSAVVTVAGRVGFGRGYTISPRYAAFSAPFIAALAFLAAATWRNLLAQGRVRSALWLSHAGAAGVAAFVVLWSLNSWQSRSELSEVRRMRLQARAILPFAELAPPDDVRLVLAPGVPHEMPHLWRRLVARGLVTDLTPRFAGAGLDAPGRGQVERAVARDDGRYEVVGWAVLPEAGRAADAILATAESAGQPRRPVAVVVPRRPRPEVVGRFDAPAALQSGWQMILESPPSGTRVRFWAIDGAAGKASPIGELTVSGREAGSGNDLAFARDPG